MDETGSLFDEMGACVLLLFHAMKRLVELGACRPFVGSLA